MNNDLTLTAPPQQPTWRPRLLAGPSTAAPSDLALHQQTWGPLPAIGGRELIELVESSGLLGRGGAGFPTGRKMRTVATAPAPAVVVANGAEGEPASAKDATLLARVPHLVLDGIQLAARAVGADTAYLVVHAGSAVVPGLTEAITLRTGDRVAVQLAQIPRPYVSSEETAVVHWLNGGPAKPTVSPPRPYERGVGRRPTLINNVETLANIGALARRGVAWFRSEGDADEPGTLLVTVSGSGVDRRVAEVPTGTTIGDLASRAALDLSTSPAVLVGGYFGSWIPADHARRLPLTHRAMRAAGTALGAGVVAVLPPDRCGVAEAARVATYLAANSAGQCGPCLNGLPAIANAMRALVSGRWDDRSWPALERWMTVIPGRGACRHPDGAVRFTASALSAFAMDVSAHRAGHPCGNADAPAWLPIPANSTGSWR
jgi:NADH:ubiquinone oxidoreductase subunit F (NADH-binding)